MTELMFYQSLSALMYLIIALTYYRIITKMFSPQEMDDLARDTGMTSAETRAACKTVAAVACALWPVFLLVAAVMS